MVLQHVAQRADLLEKAAARAYAERFRHRDLHGFHMVSIPQRRNRGIRRAKIEQFMQRGQGEKVIDAKDRFLIEHGPQLGVELARRCKIVAKRLFDGETGTRGETCAR